MKQCKYLRAKNAYGTLEGGDKPFIPVDPGTTTYWCLRTMGPVGADDGIVHLSSCSNSQRSCYREPEKQADSKENQAE